MNPPGPPTLFWMFMAVWAALSVGSAGLFWGSRNARLKRALFPWFLLFAGALFALFVVLVTSKPWVLAFVIPAVTLISFLYIRQTRFCDACGATVYNHAWFRPMRFCSQCGAPFGEADRSRGGGVG